MEVALKTEDKLSPYLCNSKANLLNIDTMPFLDLGDKPKTYSSMMSEAFQSFIAPRSSYPDLLVIHYSRRAFKTNSLVKKYRASNLDKHAVDFLDIEQTIQEATQFLLPYLGVVARFERANLIFFSIGFVLTIAASMASGILLNWTYSLLYISLYFVTLAVVMVSLKITSNKYLR